MVPEALEDMPSLVGLVSGRGMGGEITYWPAALWAKGMKDSWSRAVLDMLTTVTMLLG